MGADCQDGDGRWDPALGDGAPVAEVWPADVHCLPYVLCYSASWARGAIAWEIGESGTASGSKARKSLGGHDGGSFGNSASH
eukprot:1160400-Pelagomonas_calceolata.AAC.6